ncbi:hypothetical protein RI138_18685 [Streptomyces sp. C11-1]|uniref:PH domain-containing protein n=1 Tax=Streptomyces durocortorensis TaxID=2811104 RepID=A0ABY9VXQ1_9ACTN|nr:hypothetical protein [Streptomyces durocortorensis]WNF28692.1 hypothetical protein RI138_18685 [Streptomyces durocortorensis]
MKSIVLRRSSWVMISWAVIIGLGIGMLVAALRVTSVNGFRTGWQGIPAFLALVVVVGRVANCKIVLRRDVLVVVNLLRTYTLPAAAIREVSVGGDGTLEVHLDKHRVVSAFAFGGSLIDHFKGSSSEAARKVNAWLDTALTQSERDDFTPQVRWTRCLLADAALGLCVALTGVGMVWMAITGR